MSTKSVIVIIVLLLLVGGGMYALTQSDVGERADTEETAENTEGASDMFRVEENAVVAPDQRPGDSITVAQVYLAAPGFVVIHEDNDGEPGAILGASALLETGQNDDVEVVLSRSTVDGERLHAMLHSDTNGNGTFDTTADAPVQSRLGGPISGWFLISADAEESVDITL